jgi:type II secretory pathway component PulK
MRRSIRNKAGSALLVVLWSLIVLSAAIFAWAQWIRDGIKMHGYATSQMEARAMAHSGVTVALNPRITKTSPQLDNDLGDGLGYRVRIVSEGGKLNLNWLIGGEEPRKVAMLKQWLERKGLNFQQRERFVDCLMDYVDQDNLHRLNGAEDEGNYHAANRPLISLDEVPAVMGSEPLVSTPGWMDELTVNSNGGIDLLAAPAEILRLLPGFSEARIQRLIQLRQGPDKIEGTRDDYPFKNASEVLASIGLSERDPLIQGLFTINDPNVRILSEGRSGNVVRQVEVVARKLGLSPQSLSWKE